MGNMCAGERKQQSKYEKKLNELKVGKQKYADKEFPADAKALIKDWKSNDADVVENKDEWKQIKWIRATEIPELNDHEGQLKVFADAIEPNDIKQGGLGNCYFLSVLSCTAEKDYRIRRLFVSQVVNKEGIYAVRLTKNGEAVTVIIDDFFPTKDEQAIFTSAHGNELWVLIMEKVWAKLHGCYHRIIGGQCHQTFRDVTGAPAWEIMSVPEEGEEDTVWDQIVEGEKKNYIMAAGVSQDSPEEGERLQEFGLVGGHAYSLLAAAIVKDKKGNDVRIVNVRNPWGSFEWQGAWSDKSDCWTSAAKKQVGLTDKDDGSFWMEFEEFRQYFTRVQICKYVDHHNFASTKIKVSPKGYHLIKMKVTQPGAHTVSVSQFDERCAPLNSGHEYTNCKIIVVRTVGGTLESGVVFVKGGKGFMDRDAYVELGDVGVGTYYICVEMELHTNQNWDRHGQHIFVSNYGPGITTFQGDESTKYPVAQVLEAAFESKVRKYPDQMKVTNLKDAPEIDHVTQNDPEEGYRFIYVNNKNTEYLFQEEMTYSKLDGQQILEPHVGPHELKNVLSITDMSYKFNIAPGDSKMVIIRCNVQGYGMAGSKKTGLLPFNQ